MPDDVEDVPVKSTATLVRVIHGLKELDGAGVTELATHIGTSKSTVHRHLTALEAMQYVTSEGGTYRLGLRLLDLGGYVRDRNWAFEQVSPKVRELAQETGEGVQFVAEEHGRGVVIFRETGERAASTKLRIGTRVYLHRTAAGKAILAELGDAERDAVLDRWGVPGETANTITDREALEAELDDVRERGFAVDRGEHIAGLRAVGTAVQGPDGEVVGAISIGGPEHRMQGEWFDEELPRKLLGTVNELELNIAYS